METVLAEPKKEGSQFDFVGLAHGRLVRWFGLGETVRWVEVYQRAGVCWRLNRHQIRALVCELEIRGLVERLPYSTGVRVLPAHNAGQVEVRA